MRLSIYIFLFLLVALNANGQEEKYPSKEQDAYYKAREKKYKRDERKHDKPTSRSKITGYKSDFFEIVKLKKFSPFVDFYHFTPYQDSLDRAERANPVTCCDFPEPEKTGEVYNEQILKFEKKGTTQAIIYKGFNWANMFYEGHEIRLAISEDNGKTWKSYFTGIHQGQPVFIKWYSAIPLILEDNKFQIEAAFVREKMPLNHMNRHNDYELVKDGISVVFDLEILKKDSDNDGLTDIEERKLMLNPLLADTDKDEVPDNIDLNPRFNAPRSIRTSIYEFLIDGIYTDSMLAPFNSQKAKGALTDSTETYLIHTDNPDILSAEPHAKRIIIVSEKEYKKNNKGFRTDLDDIILRPLFKVDNMEETYKISTSIGSGGASYIITKKENGWKIDFDQIWIY